MSSRMINPSDFILYLSLEVKSAEIIGQTSGRKSLNDPNLKLISSWHFSPGM